MTKLQKNIKRYKIIEEHMERVRKGDYETARNLLYLLRNEVLRIGLNDPGYDAEIILEKIGINPTYSRNYNIATFRLKKETKC